jgi:hypothetical protein
MLTAQLELRELSVSGALKVDAIPFHRFSSVHEIATSCSFDLILKGSDVAV